MSNTSDNHPSSLNESTDTHINNTNDADNKSLLQIAIEEYEKRSIPPSNAIYRKIHAAFREMIYRKSTQSKFITFDIVKDFGKSCLEINDSQVKVLPNSDLAKALMRLIQKDKLQKYLYFYATVQDKKQTEVYDNQQKLNKQGRWLPTLFATEIYSRQLVDVMKYYIRIDDPTIYQQTRIVAGVTFPMDPVPLLDEDQHIFARSDINDLTIEKEFIIQSSGIYLTDSFTNVDSLLSAATTTTSTTDTTDTTQAAIAVKEMIVNDDDEPRDKEKS